MSNPWEWEEQDIIDLIRNLVQESLTLDYKQSEAISGSDNKRKDISKDVSSFANSEGGTIVYGVKEKDNHVPVELDSGIDPAEFSKEWLENVITSNIHPRLDGLRIKEVALSGERFGKVAYVVYVPQSTTAHMASDNKYYKRFNFKAQPMEDYEVRDVMNRTATTRLELQFVIGNTPFDAFNPVPIHFLAGSSVSEPVMELCSALDVRETVSGYVDSRDATNCSLRFVAYFLFVYEQFHCRVKV